MSVSYVREGIVDAHVHFWDPGTLDYAWLRGDARLDRAFLPAHMPRAPVPVAGLIVVQADCGRAQGAAEVQWLTALARAGAPILGVVAHASLERENAPAQIAQRAASPLVVGVRRLIQDEPAGFAVASKFVAGVRALGEHALVMDLCVRAHQIPEITALVERCPDVTFVLDHMGKPPLGQDSMRAWATDIAALAAHANVQCKLSGLSSEMGNDPRSAADLGPALGLAVELFGPARCMFGSDWPVSSTRMPYERWLSVVHDAIANLTAHQRDQVMRQTALSVYGRASTEPTGQA